MVGITSAGRIKAADQITLRLAYFPRLSRRAQYNNKNPYNMEEGGSQVGIRVMQHEKS